MENKTKIGKIVIFDNVNSEDYWLEEPLRDEYYRSELELMHYLKSEQKESEFNNSEDIDNFVEKYLIENGKTSGDIALFVKELRTFLKMHKTKSTEDNRIG